MFSIYCPLLGVCRWHCFISFFSSGIQRGVWKKTSDAVLGMEVGIFYQTYYGSIYINGYAPLYIDKGFKTQILVCPRFCVPFREHVNKCYMWEYNNADINRLCAKKQNWGYFIGPSVHLLFAATQSKKHLFFNHHIWLWIYAFLPSEFQGHLQHNWMGGWEASKQLLDRSTAKTQDRKLLSFRSV